MATKNPNIEEEKEYDDDECVKYIRNYIGEGSPIYKLDDDSITYLVDLMYDFMESRGLLEDDDFSDDIELDLTEMYEYMVKNIKRDEMNIELELEDFVAFHDAEQEYTETLLD